MTTHNELIRKATASIKQHYDRVQNSEWALQYHVAPPAFWMNDPNGFSFYKGEFHLFYQHYPYAPKWGPMHWGHAKSKDLVHWAHLPVAIAPSEDYDKDGCFSGSAIEKDGKLYLHYTGHTWTGDNPDVDLKQVQCVAVSEDGIHFTKLATNPVIENAPEGNIHPNHFRDPKVWENNGFYYSIIGSRTKDNVGQALLYRSDDLLQWEFMNVAVKGEGNQGTMWECPDLFPLNGKDILVISPQDVKQEGYLYQNHHQSGYMVGKLNYETGIFQHSDFHLLDYGFDFYAPQTMIDDQGRRILIAWMAMWESEMPEQKDNWAGAMTIPRELQLKDGKLFCTPVNELKKLRENEIHIHNVTIEGETSFTDISGNCCELQIAVNLRDANTFGLKLRVDEEESEATILSYDKREGFLTLDRNKSGKGPGGVRKAPLSLKNDELSLQILIDRSSVEIFANGGEIVMTSRIYPKQSSNNIIFYTGENEQMKLMELRKWNLKKSISISF
ncbi:glycoside hydrolase family 32 protein [Bacillus kwashiorkori]|uniref:glycoside hydrolase family 32 protein n=1 Tax=Bacillus kwashiorkori TaxID=1522318 RepID=UPI00078225EB|nr:sucrose-6-phosphate hydrolase [Bacillus kwashiorkori]